MSPYRTPEYLTDLVQELRKLPREVEWVEFKLNNSNAEEIGEYISALSNAAVLEGRPTAYLIWGIRDYDHALIGTSFRPYSQKVGNEDVVNWLVRSTRPQIHFQFYNVIVDNFHIVVLEVDAASQAPIRFKDTEWIRVGSYKKRLRDHPDHQRRLWRALDNLSFEKCPAHVGAGDGDVVALLDYPMYFDLLALPLPENRRGILQALEADKLIVRTETGRWNITNLGAVLFAKRLRDFPSVKRKALRVVQYRGGSRVETVREQEGVRGYAAGFSGMIEYITNLLPTNEVIGQSLRQSMPLYPELAIRELVANALIHQDFGQTGTGPMVELFDGRIKITSPGMPLVEPARFIDAPPKSRNESLASMMRRIGVCEERGSGWDKIGFEIELHQLPAPLIEFPQDNTRIVLFGPKPLQEMDKDERIRAVCLHACLRYVSRKHLTNSSVRERFKIALHNSATASRLISEAVEAGAIVPYDPQAARKLMKYLPARRGRLVTVLGGLTCHQGCR